MGIIKDNWSPELIISKVLLSICSLLVILMTLCGGNIVTEYRKMGQNMAGWPESGPKDTPHKLGFHNSYIICLSQRMLLVILKGGGGDYFYN